MELEVLLSCMHQTDDSIIQNYNFQNVRTLIVNQCDTSQDTMRDLDPRHRMLDTCTRGLSVSRNLAVENARAEICLLSDDDEVFCEDLETKILQAYQELPDADIIIFRLSNRFKRLGDRTKRLSKYELLRVASWQISFRLASVKGRIAFDTKLGAGTGNGGGEENKFLFDCHRAGLRIYYVPMDIAYGLEQESTWFFGYDEKYFYQRGMTTRYILGLPMSVLYGVYFLITKRPLYRKEIGIWKAGRQLFHGIIENRLAAVSER